MVNFGLNYKLLVEDRYDALSEIVPGFQAINQAIEINYPLTIEFDITQDVGLNFGKAKLNQARISVRNLSEDTRKRIQYDLYNIVASKDPNTIVANAIKRNTKVGGYKSCVLQAGYGDNLSTIFVGNIIEGGSYKEKESPDIVTFLLVSDGDFAVANAFSSFTTFGNVNAKDLINDLVNDMKGVTIGKVGDVQGNFSNFPFNGNSYYLLNKHFKNQCFIDKETVNVLPPNATFEGNVTLIDSSTGLLTTPVLKDTQIIIDILFEPRIVLGQIVEVRSSFNSSFDGQYKVIGIRHKGSMGGVMNDCTTTLILFIGYEALGKLEII